MANTLELLNSINIQFALNPPAFSGYQSNSQSLGTNSWISLGIDTTDFDNYGGHSNSTNNNRYTAQVAGWYTVNGVYAPNGNASGFRAVRITKNGTPVLGHSTYSGAVTSAEPGIVTPTKDVQLAVGDWVEVQGWQNTGGALGTTIDPDLRTGLWVRFSHF